MRNKMKLTEITIEEPFTINLTEVLNTEVHPTWITNDEGNKIGTFELHEKKYQIRLEHLPLEEFRVFHISFFVWDNPINDWSTEVTLNNKQSASIIGAIFYAIKEEMNNQIFDGFVFGTNNNIDKRMRIYNYLVNRYIKHFGHFIENLKGPSNSVFSIVCTKSVSQNFTKEEIMDIAYPYLNK